MLPISVRDGRGYVWSVEDVRKLRVEHRICGVLVGTLPMLPQQNVFLGLPLELLPEEVVLLVSQHLAYLVDDARAHTAATPEQARQAVEAQAADAAHQLGVSSAAAAAKRELASRAFASDIEAKRAKRAAARAARPESTAMGQLPPDDDAPTPTPISDAHVVRIAGSSVDAAWYDAPSHSYTSLDDARASGLWTYPSTPRERARCAVFAELHARGYFMGNGLKFGCHFLVYPGDPLRFHSHFSATVFESSEDTRIAPLDLVAYGRLATGVKKAHLLCTYDEPTGEIEMLSLEWALM